VNNLATAYSDRIRGERAENIERAIEGYQQALEVMTRQAMPNEYRRTQRNLARLYFGEDRWSEAVTAYRDALAATDLLYRAAATPEARRSELREIRDLPARLAYALSRIAAQKGDESLEQATLALEQNRARWLSETLALFSDRPPDVPQEIWETFTARRERIARLQAEARLPDETPGKRTFVTLSEELSAVYTALNQAVEQVRAYDETFMPAPSFDQIRAATGEETQALVYFAVTPEGAVTLIVHDGAVQPVWSDLTEDALREQIQGPADDPQLGGYVGAYAAWRSSHGAPGTRDRWFAALEETTGWLWDQLMGPVVAALTDLGVERAALVPQGWLGLLPLHAAWTGANGDRRYAFDDVCFAYAPNARALSTARRTAARVPADRLFAVDEPQPVSANPLPNSAYEVMSACEYFEPDRRKVLAGEAATAQAVRDQVSHYPVLHFSCHGVAGFRRPLEGGLTMAHDEMLTLRDILSLRLENARLAVLSACETGIPGTELLDEVISLPTGLAQAGIPGVVASLWSVSDLSTMMLLARFYALWQGERQSPAEALRQAQHWVRDTTNGEKAAYFKGFLPTLASEKLPSHVADALYKVSMLARPEENDFAHPFHWAAFTFTGV
jgi:CHAT domain-containing protein